MNKLYKSPEEVKLKCCKNCELRLHNLMEGFCSKKFGIEIVYVIRSMKRAKAGWRCLQYKKL